MARKPTESVDGLLKATRAIVADGQAIVDKTHQDYKLAGKPAADDSPLPIWEPDRKPQASLLAVTMAPLIQNIVAWEQSGRWITAAMALAKLRENYEAFEPRDMPNDEQTWESFAGKHVPLSAERGAELIGKMAYKGGMMRCIKCNAKAACACGCGEPYISEHRWAKVAESVPENVPKIRGRGRPRSDIRMTESERKRRYRERQRNSEDRTKPEPGSYRVSFLLRADTAWEFADYSGPEKEIDEDCCKLAETAASAWTSLARRLRETKR